MPSKEERYKLWGNSLPSGYNFEEGLTERLSYHYQLSGASIKNVMSDLKKIKSSGH